MNIKFDVHYRLGQVEAIASMLALVAVGEIKHTFAGNCPMGKDDELRDPDCVVCRTLMVWDELGFAGTGQKQKP